MLIVDDEEEVRAFTRDVLEMDGYAVLEAASAARALELGEAHPGALDLLITDVVMPGMTGPELARRLRARRGRRRGGRRCGAGRGAVSCSQNATL